ncbi:MAG: hypothetical protein KGL39_16915 [Patescibacteria group bacterium]|nr:hypothetical protein [Patescibacteria group bacterium]
MKALEVFQQKDGGITKEYYRLLSMCGPEGELAVALFRASKRSAAAKSYRRGKFRRSAYDVKSWSLSEVSRILTAHPELVTAWGWKQDPNVVFDDRPSWVMYVDTKFGQCSFHSPSRSTGPPYEGEWCGDHNGTARVIQFCDSVWNGARATA